MQLPVPETGWCSSPTTPSDHLVAAFAVWRAGATLVTIYPSSTVAELAYAIGNAGPPARDRRETRLRGHGAGRGGSACRCSSSDGTGALVGLPAGPAKPRRRRRRRSIPMSVALICLHVRLDVTAEGGDALPRRAAGRGTAYARVWHLGDDDATLVCLPLAWAFGLVTTSMATLVRRGRVVLLAPGRPGTRCSTRFVEHGVTFFAGVTTMFVKMVEALERRSRNWRGPDRACACASPAASPATSRRSHGGTS